MGKRNYYDHIADLYDQTRWLPEAVAEDIADFILTLVEATPETSFLEPGVGTGLNVLPLVKKGYAVTGMDISLEMLNQLRLKLHQFPPNLKLLQGDASQLPFLDQSFDVVLTVHMLHTVANQATFLNEIDRVLKPQGCYLHAQWIMPLARREFEQYFRTILSQYTERQTAKQGGIEDPEINVNVEEHLRNKGYRSDYRVAKQWMVSNTVEELLNFYKSKAYGFCWRVSPEIFQSAIKEFERFCVEHYGALETELSSEAKYEIWAYFDS